MHEFAPHSAAKLTAELDGRRRNFKQTIDPAKKWTLFLVPHIHVDVGYSDYQAKVAAIQSRTIDEAMDMIAQHPDFRFSLDGEWDLQQFLSTRNAAQQQRAIAAIQNKQFFVPAQYANLLTGLPTTETLIRSLYPSANFAASTTRRSTTPTSPTCLRTRGLMPPFWPPRESTLWPEAAIITGRLCCCRAA